MDDFYSVFKDNWVDKVMIDYEYDMKIIQQIEEI